ncbi:hypothetical protein [Massilia brevitalea]|uniref:hypothetical protein n=1 Tax=Massilia brevitalea TaxID=442526 RepID=UPI002738F859|nr:hypothetical protein [Massilia brevitalea]
MYNFSIWHWIILLAFIAFALFPFWRILNKAGYSGAWSILTLVPVVNLIVLWVFALVEWPVEKKSRS